jgi:hypothetical protein
MSSDRNWSTHGKKSVTGVRRNCHYVGEVSVQRTSSFTCCLSWQLTGA